MSFHPAAPMPTLEGPQPFFGITPSGHRVTINDLAAAKEAGQSGSVAPVAQTA